MSARNLLVVACSCALAGSAAEVSIDRENLRAEVQVATPGGRIVVTLDPATSLLVHCTNLYQLNLQSGARSYAVRDNELAKAAVHPEVLAQVAGKDRYFGG